MQPGTRLGPYEIVAQIGAGGMGEVYRARDTRLGRDVAVKVLPPEFAADPERLRRFEQEAGAVAALSHPHILALYDVGTHEGSPYLVTELLEGESLRERLQAGPLTPRKAIEVGAEIAQGLAAAHEKGIVHRDLKPGNVFVTRDGVVKILDFGIAKLAPQRGPEELARATTVLEATEAGRRLGTVGYMSPEQVRGQIADHRSDIFSFGCVLYEMLSGRRAFAGDTAADTMTAILTKDPEPLSGTGREVSPVLQGIVSRCLQKSPEDRFHSAHDLASDLAMLGRISDTGTGPRPELLKTPRLTRRWVRVIATAALLGAAGLQLYRQGEKAGSRSASGITFRQLSFRPQAIFQAAFAPDGETIVYSAALEGNVPELFVIRPEYPEPRPLGLPRTHLLSISSKGEMAVLTNARYARFRKFTGTLARMPLGGTAPREILEDVRQADWSPDGSELAIIRLAEGKYRLEFPIGKVLYETAGWLSALRVSPRGDRIALFEHPRRGDDRGSVIVVDRAGKHTLLSGDYEMEEGLAWSRTGDEVLFTASMGGTTAMTLYDVDLSGHRRVALRSAGGLTVHDVSRTGRWLVTRDDYRVEISVLAPGASAERDLSWLDWSSIPFLSRDGSMLLFTDMSVAAGLNYRVCLRTTAGGPVVVLGEGLARGFSPDGKWALATIDTPPQLVIYPTGPGETKRLPRGNLEAYHGANWFPDGKSVLVAGNEAGKASRCYAQDISGSLPRPITPEATSDCSISPDGQQILYRKPDGTGFIQRTGGGPAAIVPGLSRGDWVIRWSADGRALYLFRGLNRSPRFERLDLASGHHELVREVAPADRAGILWYGWGDLSDDAKSYAYYYQRLTSQLFVVEGAR